jgi:hypothetical protein
MRKKEGVKREGDKLGRERGGQPFFLLMLLSFSSYFRVVKFIFELFD